MCQKLGMEGAGKGGGRSLSRTDRNEAGLNAGCERLGDQATFEKFLGSIWADNADPDALAHEYAGDLCERCLHDNPIGHICQRRIDPGAEKCMHSHADDSLSRKIGRAYYRAAGKAVVLGHDNDGRNTYRVDVETWLVERPVCIAQIRLARRHRLYDQM